MVGSPFDLSTAKFTPEELRECYIDKQMSQREIAVYLHTDVLKVRYAMEQWDIEVRRKNASSSQPIPVEELRTRYVDMEMTQLAIAKFFRTDVRKIRAALKQADIEIVKGRGKEHVRLPRQPIPEQLQERLVDCYVNQGMSIPAIAQQFNMAYERVRRLLKNRLGKLKKRQVYTPPKAASGLRDLYSIYKRNAKQRNHAFEIAFEQFADLTQQDCYYCGIAPSQNYWGCTYNGIDRIDNSRGYVLGNVRPSCSTCNYAKGKMTEQEFYSWIERLVAHNSLSHTSAGK